MGRGAKGGWGGAGCGAGHLAPHSAASERLLGLFADRLLRHRALEALHLRVSARGLEGGLTCGPQSHTLCSSEVNQDTALAADISAAVGQKPRGSTL